MVPNMRYPCTCLDFYIEKLCKLFAVGIAHDSTGGDAVQLGVSGSHKQPRDFPH